METETPKAILLRDYKPSAWLIDTVHLDIALHPTETRVKSRLSLRPNPARKGKRGPLVLDGESLTLDGVMLDGEMLTEKSYAVSETELRIAAAPDGPFTLEIETRCNPTANKALSKLWPG